MQPPKRFRSTADSLRTALAHSSPTSPGASATSAPTSLISDDARRRSTQAPKPFNSIADWPRTAPPLSSLVSP